MVTTQDVQTTETTFTTLELRSAAIVLTGGLHKHIILHVLFIKSLLLLYLFSWFDWAVKHSQDKTELGQTWKQLYNTTPDRAVPKKCYIMQSRIGQSRTFLKLACCSLTVISSFCICFCSWLILSWFCENLYFVKSSYKHMSAWFSNLYHVLGELWAMSLSQLPEYGKWKMANMGTPLHIFSFFLQKWVSWH